MAQTKPTPSPHLPVTWFTKSWDRFEKWGRFLLWGLALFSLAYLFLGEPYLYSAWRRSEIVGELRVKSDIERRDKYGALTEAENKIELYVGDKVDADFSQGAVFVDKDGHEQAVNYPFRVQQSTQGEILFSPLTRRNGNVSWAQRRPQRIIPAWSEIISNWAGLKKQWAEFKAAYPVRKNASLKSGGAPNALGSKGAKTKKVRAGVKAKAH